MGTINGTVTLTFNIKNSELIKIDPKGISLSALINMTIDYKISETLLNENLLMKWRILSSTVSTEELIINKGPFSTNPISIKVANDKCNLNINVSKTRVLSLLKDKDLKISSYIPQKTGELEIDPDTIV